MKRFGMTLKKFLANKNTVTIVGVLIGILVLYIGYNWRIKQATQPTSVPYANQVIQPRTKITQDMISYMQVPPAMLREGVVRDTRGIVGYYTNYNTMIPEGSLFFRQALVTKDQLPNSAFMEAPEGYAIFSLNVNIETTYGNGMLPGTYVDIYVKYQNDAGQLVVGQWLQNIKILAVKDSGGRAVFENTDESRTPTFMYFALPEDLHLLIRKASYLKSFGMEIYPVPSKEEYETNPGEINVSSQDIRAFIESKSALIDSNLINDNNQDIIENDDEIIFIE